MATLKDIWDYPNNSGSGYVADTANWSGDASYGLDKRLDELLDGTYKSWPNLDPVADLSQTVDTVSELYSKYKNYVDSYESTEHLSFYKLHKYPVVEATFGARDFTVSNIKSYMNTNYEPVLRVTSTGGGFDNIIDGEQVTFSSLSNLTALNSVSSYVDKINDNNVEIYTDSGLTTEELAGVTIDVHSSTSYPKTDVFISTSTGVKMILEDGYHDTIADGDGVKFINRDGNGPFSAAGDTGTLSALDTAFYVTTGSIPTNDTPVTSFSTLEFFTDAGRTTNATLDEKYYATLTFNINNSTGSVQEYTFGGGSDGFGKVTDIGASYTFISGSDANFSELRDSFDSELYFVSFARLSYRNLTGTISKSTDGGYLGTTGTSCSNVIGTTDNLDNLFYVLYDDTTETLWIGEKTTADFNFANAFTLTNGSSVTVDVKIIDPARLIDASGDGRSHLIDQHFFGEGSPAVATPATNPYEITALNIRMPGNIKYTYQDAGNVTQNGAEFVANTFWPIDATNSVTPALAPELTVTLDGSGYLDSVGITHGGAWFGNTNSVIPVQALADEYVAPTPYPEDVWDTDDEWDSDAYSPLKQWPTHIAPSGIKLNAIQPSSVTRSQNATKYVRSSGIIRHQMEVYYPPMSYDDFREFAAVVEAARGQATPFYFKVRNQGPSFNEDIIFQRTDANKDGGLNNPYNFRVKEPVAVGDKTLLVEGFPANQTDAFIRGEVFISDELGVNNGVINQVINDNVDSNAFGEAKIRIGYGSRKNIANGVNMYKNPSWVVVTLANDEFEYNIGTDGFYRFNVLFDFDGWK